MALYKYKAQTKTGKTVSGRKQASSETALYNQLMEQGEFLIQAKVVTGYQYTRTLKPKQVAEFCRQLGTLLGSGVTLVRALSIIVEDESITKNQKNIYKNVSGLVRQGMALTDAMKEQEGAFPELLMNMLHSAEASGNMSDTCMNMAEHYTKEFKLQSKVKNAMVYPRILSVVIIVVVAIIMGYVVPQFQLLFSQMESLPATTTILLGISGFIQAYWIVLIIGVIFVVLSWLIIAQIPRVRLVIDFIKINLPVIGLLQKMVYTARFARTLSSLYSAGIPIITTLQIAKSTIGNAYIEKQFGEVIRKVRTGESLHSAIGEVDGFTNKLASSIKVGEETGKLESMLLSSAENLDYEAELAVGRMVAYVEPAMIIFMALIVGFIMIAVITPIYGSYESIGSGMQY